MNPAIASLCFYCKLPVNPQVDDFCPHCRYPASPAKEEDYLTSAIASLQQAMSFGGAQLKVGDLFQRYQHRLRMLQKQKASPTAPSAAIAHTPEAVALSSKMVVLVPLPVDTLRNKEVTTPPVPVNPPEPRQVFAWRSFFADQAVNIVASLGAFLILVGALSFVATTTNLLLAFLIVFGIHAVFGITGVVTRRFASFRIVASIYTIIFALLVPLVGFSAYRLVGGNNLELSAPVLIASSALYAAIVYIMLALFQRYTPFAYLGMAALAVTDLAIASALNLAYWWWPSMLMILALISLVSIAPSPTRIFAGNRAILRQPIHIFMNVFVVMGTLAMVAITLYSVILDSSMSHSTEAGYAILCLSLLRLAWSAGRFLLARRTRGVIMLALLFLVCALAGCYALQFDATDYALTLTIVALLYAGISRFAVQLLQPLGRLELELDWFALILVLLVPFIASPTLPVQLVAQIFTFDTAFPVSWQTFAELAAITAGIVLVLSIAFKRAGFQSVPRKPAWRWLLLFGAFLFTCAYSLIILALHLNPTWSFLGTSIVFMVGAVIVRQRTGDAWADPLDLSALITIVLTLGLSVHENPDVIGILLLFFFAATYAILQYQRRATWLFVPTIFALIAIPALLNHPIILLTLGIAFPLAAVAIRHSFTFSNMFSKETVSPYMEHPTVRGLSNQWEWPLLVIGFVYGGVVVTNDIISSTSISQFSLGIPCPVAIEVALFAVSWYAAAALARVKAWLLPALTFALGAILFPTNSFLVLVCLTPVLAILAAVVRRFAGNTWSAPFAVVALLSGIMAGYTGFSQQHLTATAMALLAFAILAYVIGIIEDASLPMWITPFFATWSVIVSAGYLNDPFRPTIVVMVAATLGVVVGLYKCRFASIYRQRRALSALPLYTTALFAALFISFWPQDNPAQPTIITWSMLAFTSIALLIMLVERRPELLVFPVGFAARAIWLWYPQLDFTSLMFIYTMLCVLVFVIQFIWRVLPPMKGWLAATTLHEVLSIGGLASVVMVILSWNGFSSDAGTLAQVGAGALLALAALIFTFGLLRPYTIMLSLPPHTDETTRLRQIQLAKAAQRWCYYTSGLLLSLVISWELTAFRQTQLDVLLLAPASYLTVIAPFLMRDSVIRERRSIGQLAAVLGACLLLLPALCFSFGGENLLPTAILLGESLALLTLGMLTRVRIFILSGAGLIIVGTLRALFLATPPWLTLMLTGITLLVIATALILARRKLQVAWQQWD